METTAMGRNLQRLRKSSGLTQEQLASKTGVARTTIARIEGGWYEGAKSTTLSALAKVLDCTVADLLDENARCADPAEARGARGLE